MRVLAVTSLIILGCFHVSGQAPESNFVVGDLSICINESLELENTSTDADSYEWDFCVGDLEESPTIEVAGDVSGGPYSHTFVKEGADWYAFSISRGNNNITRFNYGNNIYNEPTTETLSNPSSLLSTPHGLDIIYDGSNYYGFAVNTGTDDLVRIEFGTSITNETPTAVSLGDFAGLIVNPDNLRIVYDGVGYKCLIASGDELVILDFGLDLSSTPSASSITGFSRLWGIGLVEIESNWYGLWSDTNSDKIYHANFGDVISSVATVTEIDVSSLGLADFRGVDFVRDGNNYYGFFTVRLGNLVRLDFGSDPSVTTPILSDFGDIDAANNNNSVALRFQRDSSRWAGFATDFGGEIYRVKYELGCGVNVEYSEEENPIGITYSSSGTFPVVLTAIDLNGNSSAASQDVTVLSSVAPEISFTVDESSCIANTNIFTPSNIMLSTYSWDFDGDGLEDSDEVTPTYEYSLAGGGPGVGTYTVRLDVSDGTCANFYELELTIYPEPPVPVVSAPSPTECTGVAITFSNMTDESSHSGVITYAWDFESDGEVDSTEPTPTHTYMTTGMKTVTVTSVIPGCESSAATIDIDILEGPAVDFEWVNNCFGGEIDFINNTTGEDITGYSWDFGDGNTSMMVEPSHTYTDFGVYDVTLTVTNMIGCETILIKEIEVSVADLATISTAGVTVNEETTLSGIDSTPQGDTVETWTWFVDGEEIGVTQDIITVFDEVRSYDLDLGVTTSQGCTQTVTAELFVEAAVAPTTSFTVGAEACIEQVIEVTNTTINALTYEWDFCTGDLSKVPTIQEVKSVTGGPYSHILVEEDGIWFGFSSSRSNNTISRFSYGSSIYNDPSSEVIISNPSGLLSTPHGLDIIYDGSNYYGFAVNTGTDDLVRIEFGTSITNETPTAVSLGDFAGLIVNPDNLRIVYDGVGYKCLIASGDELVILDFGLDLSSTPSASSITGFSRLWGIGLVEIESNWYGLWSDTNSDKIYHANFGDVISSVATVTEIDVSSLGLADFRGVDFVRDGNNYYGFFTVRLGNLVRLDFGSNPSMTTPSLIDYGDIDPLNSNTIGLQFRKDRSRWAGFSTDFGGEVYRIQFELDCGVSIDFSTEESPGNVSYSQSGLVKMSLTSFDVAGNSTAASQNITVLSSVAPEIDFSLINNCISSSIDLNPSLTGLSSYSWDFNNDGIEDSNLENPEVLFDTLGGVGTYLVRLDVDDGTCHNFTEQEITIYPEPPTPIVLPSVMTQCLGTNVEITNNTDETQHFGVLTYQWDFNEDGIIDSTDPEPSFSFSEPGIKTISVYTEIPGCNSSTESIEITILDGPTSNFTATTVCDGEAVSFNNTSENSASYEWDFTDGITSTSENPDHVFPGAGSYFVVLTATDENGCEDIAINEVLVQDIPEVLFDYTIVCNSSSGNLFEDRSTVNNSDIVAWSWSVGGTEVSTDQNPSLSFEEPGIVDIALTVTSGNGCQSSYSEEVEILQAPIPDFSFSIGCVGEVSSFSDMTSSDGSEIQSWIWDVNGTTYLTENIDHVFNAPGLYEVTLEVGTQNFCSESITQIIEVLQLPELDFLSIGDCENEIISVSDMINVYNDPIVSQKWLIGNNPIGNGNEVFISGLDPGTYDLTLQVETENGCVVNDTRQLVVNNAPVSLFSANKLYGVPDENFSFSNESVGASTYVWLQDGAVINESENISSLSFAQAGDYSISLTAMNDLGCSDTLNQEITIRVPEVDLLITNFDIVEENNIGSVLVEIENQSNLPIDATSIRITLENLFSVTETVNEFIDVGESKLIALNTGIPLELSEPAYFCVSIESQYAQYADITPLNNEKCLTIEPSIVVEDPFPNPVVDLVRLKLVTPTESFVIVSVISSSGKLELKERQNTSIGLNNIFIDMSDLNTGLYFVLLEIDGNTIQKKLLKI